MKEVMLINVVIYAFSHFDNLTLFSLPDLKDMASILWKYHSQKKIIYSK